MPMPKSPAETRGVESFWCRSRHAFLAPCPSRGRPGASSRMLGHCHIGIGIAVPGMKWVDISRTLSTVAIATIVGLSTLVSERTEAQVVRDPETPYHFLRYDDVRSDEQNPAWPNDFWTPLKFIPLDIAPDSYINFGGELRERVEHFTNPFFGLTPRGSTTYLLHRLLIEGDLHI